jgi:hypothetical protein
MAVADASTSKSLAKLNAHEVVRLIVGSRVVVTIALGRRIRRSSARREWVEAWMVGACVRSAG